MAAAETTFTVEGLIELDRELEYLKGSIRKRVARTALAAGAEIVQQQAKANVPIKTGALQKSIIVKAGRSRRPHTINVVVITGKGWFKGDTFYGGFIEFGTKFIRPREFIKRAWDQTKDHAMGVIIRVLRQEIESRRAKARGVKKETRRAERARLAALLPEEY